MAVSTAGGCATRSAELQWPALIPSGHLQDLFEQVFIPAVVADEVLTGGIPEEEARITAALEAGWLRIAGPITARAELSDFNEGEAASNVLALAMQRPELLLIDERSGRALSAASPGQ